MRPILRHCMGWTIKLTLLNINIYIDISISISINITTNRH